MVAPEYQKYKITIISGNHFFVWKHWYIYIDLSFREGWDTIPALDVEEDDSENEIDDESENQQPDMETYLGTTCNQIKSREEVQEFLSDHPCITYCSQLIDLANLNVPKFCTNKDCGTEVTVVKEVVASAVYLKWVI